MMRVILAGIRGAPGTPGTIGGVGSFNARTGAITLTGADVNDALGYSPADSASLAAVAATGAYADLIDPPTIPTTAGEVGAATAAQGAKADTAVQPAALTAALADKVDVDGVKVLSDENYTSAEKSKLAGLESSHWRGLYATLGALQTAYPTASAGDYADVDAGIGSDTIRHLWDVDDAAWKPSGSGAPLTAADVKSLYEANADTNAYTDAEKAKLGDVAAGANNYSHPNHSGDVTSTGDGATVIVNNAVTNAKLADMVTARIKGRVTAATGDPEDLTAAQVRTMLDVADSAALSATIDAKITSSNRTDTATSGTGSTSALNVSVAPNANSTRVSIGKKVEISYSSSFNITTGGYVVAGQDVLNTAGTGTIDKLVGRMVQLNLTGGNIAAAVGVETVLSTIAPGTTVAGLAFNYVANMAGVPNIANVLQMAAFQNDEPRAHILNRGKYLDGDLIEFSPPYHIGLLANRYYSAPARSMTANVVTANVIYVTFVTVPSRKTITKLGFNVTTAATGNGIVGLYKVKDGTLTTIVAQTSSLSTATTGAKEGAISAEVNPGTYALVAVFSGTPTISWHEIASHHAIGALSATGFSEFAYITPYAFAALPATANIVPTFAANTIEPHLWYRMGV